MANAAFTGAKSAFGAMRDVQGDQATRPLILCGDKDVLEPVRAALAAGAAQGSPALQVYALRRLEQDDRKQLAKAAAVIYGGRIGSSLDDATRADLEVVGAAKRPKLGLLEALDLPSRAATEAARVRGIEPDDLIPFRRGQLPVERALRELADRTEASGPFLAANLPAFRPHVTERLIETAARRNARLALMIFIPGADMPVLTATQMRLVLRIAACYGQEISQQRAIELLGVLGAGLGFRQLARSMLDFIPVAGWVLQSAIAYAGTRAVGTAAVQYFERGAVADVSNVRAFAEGARVELQQLVDRMRAEGVEGLRQRFRDMR
jgi:uncharacterized protein (DUF697 family)